MRATGNNFPDIKNAQAYLLELQQEKRVQSHIIQLHKKLGDHWLANLLT